VVVSLASDETEADQEDALIRTLRVAGHAPRWMTASEDATGLSISSSAPVNQDATPDGG
jgi:hypothetical protein